MQKTSIQSLGWEDPLEEAVETHPVFLPGESHGQRSLAGNSPWGRTESDRTEQLSTAQHRWTSSCNRLNTVENEYRTLPGHQLCTPVLSGLTGCCPPPSVMREHHPPCITGPGKDQIQNAKHECISLSHREKSKTVKLLRPS